MGKAKKAKKIMQNDKLDEQNVNLESNWDESVKKFEELELNEELLSGIYGIGFEKPSAIQQKGILPILKKRDTICQAQSGSGKTATFTIGMLQLIDPSEEKIQSLILAPTRELAIQIQDIVTKLGVYLKIKVHLCVGGTNVVDDISALREGCHVVVGTPGRVYDMMKKNHLNPSYLRLLILDEADEMLGQGFLGQVNDILKLIPVDTQIVLVSATMSPQIIKMTENIMNDPVKILVKNEDVTLKGIKQFYINCNSDDIKFENMLLIFGHMDITQCIIYVNTVEKSVNLAAKMRERDFAVSYINGDMPQEDRMKIMREFRSGTSRMLISTDLLARGIDVHQVGLVINFDLPNKKENYIHRVGRSGRYGRRGVAINLITKLEARFMIEIEECYSTQIAKLPDDISQI